jgi:hypothetical protein
MMAYWKLLKGKPAPFGALAWDHALADLRRNGDDPAEAEIAQRAQELMALAHAGPADEPPRSKRKPTARDRRVAALTEAARPSLPAAGQDAPRDDQHEPARDDPQEPDPGTQAPEEDDDALAPVVPLGVFDARKEPRRWW